ncbi:MAG TPA: capreomycidine synthase [Rugosimonospora sp.]|nr:capreomycidine synthase [Rugosimonospora sp.]
MSLGTVRPAELEDWLRTRYFQATVDISSSGVQPYRLGEILDLTAMPTAELLDIEFRDSPSLGHERLRAALAARFAPGGGQEPLVTHGSTEAILLAVSALVSPGDEVVVTAPAYHALTSVADTMGAHLRVWRLPPERSFRPDLRALRSLVGPRTRAVIVNLPHNPTGVTLAPAEYAELLSIVDDSGAYLLWDASFAELVYRSVPLPDPSTVVRRCVSFGTLSKAYGLPGLRVGWCFAPADLLPRMVRMRDYVTLASSPLVEAIAARVVEQGDRVLASRLRQARENLGILDSWLAAAGDDVDGYLPDGGVTVFPRIAGVSDTRPLCSRLAAECGVLVVPGDCFGHPDRVRIGFGGAPGELRAGLAALRQAGHEWRTSR